MTTMDLSKLLITQPALREAEQVAVMAEYVRCGGRFDARALSDYAHQYGDGKSSPLIQVNVFEDGKRFVRDGHHRCVSIWEAGRKRLYESEYREHPFQYQDFLDIVFDKGWVTPHDPRTHMRIPDLVVFKAAINHLLETQSEERARIFIEANPAMYITPRTIWTVEELHQIWQDQVKPPAV